MDFSFLLLWSRPGSTVLSHPKENQCGLTEWKKPRKHFLGCPAEGALCSQIAKAVALWVAARVPHLAHGTFFNVCAPSSSAFS